MGQGSQANGNHWNFYCSWSFSKFIGVKLMKNYKPYWSKSLNKEELFKLDAVKLERIGRKHGIELDRRRTKESLVDTLYAVL